jgi:hypothetical protein
LLLNGERQRHAQGDVRLPAVLLAFDEAKQRMRSRLQVRTTLTAFTRFDRPDASGKPWPRTDQSRAHPIGTDLMQKGTIRVL